MESRRSHQHELVVVLVTVIGLSRFLDGPLLWPVAGLVLSAAALGSRQLLTEGAPGRAPIEAAIVPAVAAVASLGALRLVPLGLGLLPALAAAALLLDRCLGLEVELRDRLHGPTPTDRTILVLLALVVAFLAFAGVGAIVPGGLVEASSTASAGGGEAPGALSETNLVLLAIADAVVAALLGYRFTALRGAGPRDATLSALSYGAAIAIGAAGLRAMAIPRLVGPALLTLILFLWDTFRGSSPSLRRDPRWLWQLALLVILAVAVVGWNLQLRK